MNIKSKPVGELSGAGLLWAFVLAQGGTPIDSPFGILKQGASSYADEVVSLKTVDIKALMIEKHIGIERPLKGQAIPTWRAVCNSQRTVPAHERGSDVVSAWSPDFDEAVLRCFIKSILGESLEVQETFVAELYPSGRCTERVKRIDPADKDYFVSLDEWKRIADSWMGGDEDAYFATDTHVSDMSADTDDIPAWATQVELVGK